MTAPSTGQVRQMLLLREQRERRARAEFELRRKQHAAAAEAAERASSALTLQMVIRRTQEARIYRDMLGRALSPREIERVTGGLSTLKQQVASATAQAEAASRAATAAEDVVDQVRGRFRTALQARHRWEEILVRVNSSAQLRAAVVEELGLADLRHGRSVP
jgi:type III secretion system (T3SS) protein YscO